MTDTANYIDDFKFFLPLDIKKAEKKAGEKTRWVLGGIASTASKDAQGETLSLEGFDISKMIWANWEHSSNPSDQIGEIIEKRVIKGVGLYIEVELFQDNPKAQEIWDLAQSLKKSGNGNNLCFSVEGTVVERDTENPAKVLKAALYGVAICKTPVNADTFAQVIHKCTIAKSMDIPATEDTHKESVEHGKKKKKTKKVVDGKEVEDDKEEKNEKKLTKSEVYAEIFAKFAQDINKCTECDSLDLAKGIYSYVQSYHEIKLEMANITQESLKKAFESLGVEAPEVEAKVEETPAAVAETTVVEKAQEATVVDTAEAPVVENTTPALNAEELTEMISKSFDSKFQAVGNLLLFANQENAELKKSLADATEVLKGLATFNQELEARLNNVEKTPIRKSVQVPGARERFEGENDTTAPVGDANTFDLKKAEDRDRLGNLLLEKSTEGRKITDKVLAKGVSTLEIGKTIYPETEARLAELGYKIVR